MARDSFLFFFVGSKLPQMITNTAGEKDHPGFWPSSVKLVESLFDNTFSRCDTAS